MDGVELAPQAGRETFERAFLDIRARLLDVAASLDRVGRADGGAEVTGDPRYQAIRRALQVLLNEPSRRTEAIQQLFSIEYDPDWPRPTPRL